MRSVFFRAVATSTQFDVKITTTEALCPAKREGKLKIIGGQQQSYHTRHSVALCFHLRNIIFIH